VGASHVFSFSQVAKARGGDWPHDARPADARIERGDERNKVEVRHPSVVPRPITAPTVPHRTRTMVIAPLGRRSRAVSELVQSACAACRSGTPRSRGSDDNAAA